MGHGVCVFVYVITHGTWSTCVCDNTLGTWSAHVCAHVSVCVYVCDNTHGTWSAGGSQRTTFRNQVSPSPGFGD